MTFICVMKNSCISLIEWNWYILKFSSQPASKVVICDARMCTRFSIWSINQCVCINVCGVEMIYVYKYIYIEGDRIIAKAERIINFIKFSKCLKILWFNKKCSTYDNMVKKRNFCLTCYAKFADGRCIHYSRWRPTITWPCIKKDLICCYPTPT